MYLLKKFALTGLLFLLCSTSILSAKSKILRPDNKIIRKADNLFIFGDYKNALPIYQKLTAMNSENAQFNYRLGVCYFYSGTDVLKCIPYFEKAKTKFTDENEEQVDLYYYLGTTYQVLNRFDDAIDCFTKLKSYILPDKEGAEDIRDLDNQIAACNKGKELMQHPVKVTISNLGANVNSEYPDYAPVISSDQSMLMFTSKRKECTGGRTDEEGNYYEDVFISRKIKKGDWQLSERLDSAENIRKNYFPFRFSKSKSMGNSINTREHDASVALSPDGKQLYIYRLDDIWVSDYKNEKWEKPSKLNNFISAKKSHEPSVSLSMDEKTLYFVSEREGGFGGKDIYMSEKQTDGTWGEPHNLGATINSEYDEDAPYIDPQNKILYFSSEAHGSMGGFDIFKSTFENGNWTVPENLGYPINSGADDIFFVFNNSQQTAYFSSIRDGGLGNYDIYQVNYGSDKTDRFIKTLLAVTQNDKLKNGETYIEIINQDRDRDSMKLTNSSSDGGIYKPGETYSMSITTPSSAKHVVEFTLPENSKSNNYFQEIAFDEMKNEKGEITGYKTTLYNAFFDLDSAIKNTEFAKIPNKTEAYSAYLREMRKKDTHPGLVISSMEESATGVSENMPDNKIMKIDPVFFEYAATGVDTVYKARLQEVCDYMIKNPSVKIMLTGHTDSKGDADYNQKLSYRRAAEVKKYLVQKGVSQSRFVVEGKGENDPFAANTNPDGSDNPEGRKLNRRVELKIKIRQ